MRLKNIYINKNINILKNVINTGNAHCRQKLLPLEKEYQFHDFHSPALDDPDFDARWVGGGEHARAAWQCPLCQ